MRRLIRHSSLETINTNVTVADEFVWVDSYNRYCSVRIYIHRRPLILPHFIHSQAGGTATVALVQPRRPACHPERPDQGTFGTSFHGNRAAFVLLVATGLGADRTRNAETDSAAGHVFQTRSVLCLAYRLITSFGRQLH